MSKKKSVPRWLQIVSTIVANAAIVLSVIYIVFYILDGFNPIIGTGRGVTASPSYQWG